MIVGAHVLIYAEDTPACAFFRDVLGWQNVDAGDGWLIPGAGEIGLYQPKHASPLPEFSG